MRYIRDNLFDALMERAKPINTRSPWSMGRRLSEYPVLREFAPSESGRALRARREERARVYDTLAGELVVMITLPLRGAAGTAGIPRFWSVARSAYESALLETEAAR